MNITANATANATLPSPPSISAADVVAAMGMGACSASSLVLGCALGTWRLPSIEVRAQLMAFGAGSLLYGALRERGRREARLPEGDPVQGFWQIFLAGRKMLKGVRARSPFHRISSEGICLKTIGSTRSQFDIQVFKFVS